MLSALRLSIPFASLPQNLLIGRANVACQVCKRPVLPGDDVAAKYRRSNRQISLPGGDDMPGP